MGLTEIMKITKVVEITESVHWKYAKFQKQVK